MIPKPPIHPPYEQLHSIPSVYAYNIYRNTIIRNFGSKTVAILPHMPLCTTTTSICWIRPGISCSLTKYIYPFQRQVRKQGRVHDTALRVLRRGFRRDALKRRDICPYYVKALLDRLMTAQQQIHTRRAAPKRCYSTRSAIPSLCACAI